MMVLVLEIHFGLDFRVGRENIPTEVTDCWRPPPAAAPVSEDSVREMEFSGRTVPLVAV